MPLTMQQAAKKLKNHFYEYRKKWLITCLTGLFLFIVLYCYKAYDIQQNLSYSGHSLFIRSIVFAVMTSISFGIHEFWIAPTLRLNTVTKTIGWHLWEVFFGMNVTFLLFNYFWNWQELYWSGYFLMLGEYFLVMIFPLALTYQIKDSKAQVLEEMLTFVSENGKHQLKMKPSNFLYMKSEDNYIAVFYVSGKQVKSELLRTTIKAVEQAYPNHSNILRCHRSYLVNPKNIDQVLLQPKQVVLDLGFSAQVPVSKSYQALFVSS